ncbi:thermonuclease family protein [Snodgrassella communis]|uniref:TNase-like domain-containing protein n=2 Tax=Snodgrassella TaxID=1193515 RepID=A0A2N9XPE7_9NEIS|nr:thermonuclease family protein [Snodgrassella communis]PIT50202.1 hypothetical protein BHC48_07290 [Snodgrassella communis]
MMLRKFGLLWLVLACTTPVFASTLNCKVIKISDGDTIRCLDNHNTPHRIRFAGINAPESKQAFGQKSKQALAGMIFQQQVQIDIKGTDRYGREIGIVYFNGQDINRRMVEIGYAWSYQRYPQKGYAKVEMAARKQKLGLWKDPHPIYPENYRHLFKGNH